MNSKLKTTLIRIMSAVIFLPFYFFFIMTNLFDSVLVLVASTIVSSIALVEFYQIAAAKKEGKPFIIPGVLTSIVINVMMYLFAYGQVSGYQRYISLYDVRPFFAVIAVLFFVTMIYHVFKRPLKGGIYSLSTTIFGVMFIVVSFSHIILMKALPNGVIYIFLLHLVIMMNDSFAYFGGILFGNHKVGFEVSPNKSWEGYFSGLLFSVITMVIANEVIITFWDKVLFTKIEAVLLGIILSMIGAMGDLIESSIKRDAEIKDSGSIIPGHGGMWDVFDAAIFAFPVFYYFLKIKGV